MIEIVWECWPCGWAQVFAPEERPPICPCCHRPLLKMAVRDEDGVDFLVE